MYRQAALPPASQASASPYQAVLSTPRPLQPAIPNYAYSSSAEQDAHSALQPLRPPTAALPRYAQNDISAINAMPRHKERQLPPYYDAQTAIPATGSAHAPINAGPASEQQQPVVSPPSRPTSASTVAAAAPAISHPQDSSSIPVLSAGGVTTLHQASLPSIPTSPSPASAAPPISPANSSLPYITCSNIRCPSLQPPNYGAPIPSPAWATLLPCHCQLCRECIHLTLTASSGASGVPRTGLNLSEEERRKRRFWCLGCGGVSGQFGPLYPGREAPYPKQEQQQPHAQAAVAASGSGTGTGKATSAEVSAFESSYSSIAASPLPPRAGTEGRLFPSGHSQRPTLTLRRTYGSRQGSSC